MLYWGLVSVRFRKTSEFGLKCPKKGLTGSNFPWKIVDFWSLKIQLEMVKLPMKNSQLWSPQKMAGDVSTDMNRWRVFGRLVTCCNTFIVFSQLKSRNPSALSVLALVTIDSKDCNFDCQWSSQLNTLLYSYSWPDCHPSVNTWKETTI